MARELHYPAVRHWHSYPTCLRKPRQANRFTCARRKRQPLASVIFKACRRAADIRTPSCGNAFAMANVFVRVHASLNPAGSRQLLLVGANALQQRPCDTADSRWALQVKSANAFAKVRGRYGGLACVESCAIRECLC